MKLVPTGSEEIRPTVSEVSPPPEDGGNPLEDGVDTGLIFTETQT